MHFIENFYIKTLKYDLVNKFLYKSTKKLPVIKKIILNFGCKTNDIKYLAASLLALELITNQKSSMTLTRHSNILLKIRKGNPTGCKVTLRKKKMFNCFSKFLTEIFPKLKNFNGFKLNRKMKKNAFSYELHDTFNFQELEEHYYLFNSLPNFDITIVTTTKTKEELIFILNSFKFPFR
jgi:large subunit ribosomal protein L5